MLAKSVADNQKNWDECLPQVAFCYNASMHESTQWTPFFLMHGTEPRWDVDIQMGPSAPGTYSSNDYADVLIRRLEAAHENAREHLHTTATRMQDWYDKKVHVQSFEVGDEVYILNLRLYPGKCHKWLRRFSDTAVVTKKLNDVTYIVKGEGWKKEKIVHVDKMKLKNRETLSV
jgi:hypothetical protein